MANQGAGGGTPFPRNVLDRLTALLSTTRGKAIAGGGAAVIVLAGGIVALNASGSEEAAPTTTTSTTTTAPPTTPPPPPPPPTYPLTGLPVTDPAVAARAALVVKIDNVEPASRPQIGINQADIVYEERVEGAVTRFLTVFHSTDAMPVGPVRSARTSDIGLFKPLGTPLFAWSGANAIFAGRIREAGIVDVGHGAASDQYHRAGDRRAPHNLMLNSTVDVFNAGYGGTVPTPLFTYRAPGEPAAGGTPAGGVNIVFATGSGSAPVDYAWNGTGWARWQSGTPHVDAEGVQVAPENLIVSFTPYADSDVTDSFGVPIREAQTVGEGDAWVFTGGQIITAHWVKPALETPTQYLDAAGQPIRLTPGRTWVAVAEPGTATIL
ncbi:MAG TPA: DUF3048 domain-containing protein [Acidimicrobiales bacterium]|nr:DUF3048 domain-containing protein [Acidimicrobiales bacterium]